MIAARVELQRDIRTKGVKEVLSTRCSDRPGLSLDSGPRDRVAYQIGEWSSSRDQLAEGQYISGQIHVPAFKKSVCSRQKFGKFTPRLCSHDARGLSNIFHK